MPMPSEVEVVVGELIAEGFKVDKSQHKVDPAMSNNGPYEVLARLKRKGLTVTIEQNSVNEDLGGSKALITYPPVAILESAHGRVACSATDLKLILAVAGDLDG